MYKFGLQIGYQMEKKGGVQSECCKISKTLLFSGKFAQIELEFQVDF